MNRHANKRTRESEGHKMQPNRQNNTIFNRRLSSVTRASQAAGLRDAQIPYALLAGGVSLLAYLAAGAVFL